MKPNGQYIFNCVKISITSHVNFESVNSAPVFRTDTHFDRYYAHTFCIAYSASFLTFIQSQIYNLIQPRAAEVARNDYDIVRVQSLLERKRKRERKEHKDVIIIRHDAYFPVFSIRKITISQLSSTQIVFKSKKNFFTTDQSKKNI